MMQKNVFVIGASGDIGRAICKELKTNDYNLILHYNKNKLAIEELVQDLGNETVLQVVQADLTNSDDVHRICHEVAYPVYGIVYVSGIAHYGLFQDTSEELMDKMLTLHVKSPWLVTQYFLPQMIRERAGKIIFITSIWGNVGASNEVIYSSVKGAQNSFVKALAKEVGPSGISVNAVSPGFIDTNMNSHLMRDEKANIIAEIPVNRPGLATDVAHTVAFLMDEKSNYIQGEIVNLTGGW